MYWHRNIWEKIKRYYLGTYVKISECATLVKVIEVGSSYSRLQDIDGNVYEINMANGYNLDWAMPVNRIYFQHNNQAYLLVRTPLRQYLRGFGPTNCALYKVNSEGGLLLAGSQWDILNSLVNKQEYPTFEQAIVKLGSGGFASIALTQTMAH